MNYISWLYWFNSRPDPLTHQGLTIILSITVGLVIIGLAEIIGTLSLLKIPKRISHKLVSFCFTNAFIALFIVFLNYELVPYLRARIIYIIWAIIVIIWLSLMLFSKKKRMQTIRSSREDEIKKYLPS